MAEFQGPDTKKRAAVAARGNPTFFKTSRVFQIQKKEPPD